MNLSTITTKVCEFAPDAKDVRCVDAGRGVWNCVATVNARTKAVPFTETGLYGVPTAGIWSDYPKSEVWLAAQIARELMA